MIAIARCESTLKQFYSNGEVVEGIVDPRDRGLFQINQYYHLESAEALGLDIETLEGNIKYARVLYDQNGFRDWSASKGCHGHIAMR